MLKNAKEIFLFLVVRSLMSVGMLLARLKCGQSNVCEVHTGDLTTNQISTTIWVSSSHFAFNINFEQYFEVIQVLNEPFEVWYTFDASFLSLLRYTNGLLGAPSGLVCTLVFQAKIAVIDNYTGCQPFCVCRRFHSDMLNECSLLSYPKSQRTYLRLEWWNEFIVFHIFFW